MFFKTVRIDRKLCEHTRIYIINLYNLQLPAFQKVFDMEPKLIYWQSFEFIQGVSKLSLFNGVECCTWRAHVIALKLMSLLQSPLFTV